MEEFFTIKLLHKGVEKLLSGKLRISAYTHQFIFIIGESEIILEKDDEGNFRAFTTAEFARSARKTDPSLVQALILEMEKEMKD